MRQDPEKVVHLLLEQLAPYFETEPRLSSIQAETLLRKIYATRYGFVSVPQLEANPTLLVTYRFAEDVTASPTMDDHLEDFLDLEIHQATGLSWVDYLHLPRPEIERLNNAVRRRRSKQNTATSNAVKKAEEDLKGLKNGG